MRSHSSLSKKTRAKRLLDLGDLALHRPGELPGPEEPSEALLEAGDELDLDLGAVGRGRGGRRVDAGGLLEGLQLGHDRGGDGVELGARLEVGLVVDDAGLELLVAELERDVGEGHLGPRRHHPLGRGLGQRLLRRACPHGQGRGARGRSVQGGAGMVAPRGSGCNGGGATPAGRGRPRKHAGSRRYLLSPVAAAIDASRGGAAW